MRDFGAAICVGFDPIRFLLKFLFFGLLAFLLDPKSRTATSTYNAAGATIVVDVLENSLSTVKDWTYERLAI